MKKTNLCKSLILILLFLMAFVFGAVLVSAETTAPTETYAIESFVEGTTTLFVEDLTEGEVDATESLPQDVTEGVTEATEPTTRPEPTYPESLPEIDETDIVIPPVIGELKEENEPALFWGFVAWVCIGVGAAVILAVLLTTKTRAYRGGGKKRYSTGDKISGKKRLLNDQYYNNNKRK